MTETLRLEETPTEKLYELLKLLEKHPGKLEEWTDDLREDLIDYKIDVKWVLYFIIKVLRNL